jgi:hypothetical protein
MGRHRLRTLALALTLCFGSALAEAQEPEDPAADLYQAGAAAASDGKWEEAAAKFEQAVAIRATPVGLFNLAQAERNLGRLAAAKRHFVSARSMAIRDGADDVRRLADDALASINPRLSRLILALPPDAAHVEAQVDGRPAEITDGEIELDPGKHEIVITAAGEKPFHEELSFADGQKRKLVVSFRVPETVPPPPAVAPAAPPPTKPVAAEPASSGPPLGAMILGGVGIAALGAGTYFHVQRNTALDDAAMDCVRTGNGWRCPSSLENDPSHRGHLDDADRAELYRNVFIGVGAGAVVAGGVWWALSGGHENKETGVALALDPRPSSPSARVRVAF